MSDTTEAIVEVIQATFPPERRVFVSIEPMFLFLAPIRGTRWYRGGQRSVHGQAVAVPMGEGNRLSGPDHGDAITKCDAANVGRRTPGNLRADRQRARGG